MKTCWGWIWMAIHTKVGDVKDHGCTLDALLRDANLSNGGRDGLVDAAGLGSAAAAAATTGRVRLAVAGHNVDQLREHRNNVLALRFDVGFDLVQLVQVGLQQLDDLRLGVLRFNVPLAHSRVVIRLDFLYWRFLYLKTTEKSSSKITLASSVHVQFLFQSNSMINQ